MSDALLTTAPNPPAHLGRYGRKIWLDVAANWVEAGLLHRLDLYLLDSFAALYETCRHLEKDLLAEGGVVPWIDHRGVYKGERNNPKVTALAQLRPGLSMGYAAFGIGMHNRAALGGGVRPARTTPEDLLEAAIGGGD